MSLSNPDDGYNNAIIVPISLFQRLFGQDGNFREVLCRALTIKDIPDAKKI